MKTLILLTVASLSCLNYAVQAMDPPEKDGTVVQITKSQSPQKLTAEDQESVINILSTNPLVGFFVVKAYEEVRRGNSTYVSNPVHDILPLLAYHDASLLPPIMLTCKSWNLATKDLQAATTTIFKIITEPCNSLNFWFDSNHGYKAADGKNADNLKAFKAGFKQIVFKLGQEKREKEVLMPTIKTLRHYLYSLGTEFSDNFVKMSPDFAKPSPYPDTPLQFSYQKVFLLYNAQRKLPNHLLEKINNCLYELNSFIASSQPTEDQFQKVFVAGGLQSFGNFLSLSQNEFQSLRSPVMSLYKLALIEKGYDQKFYNGIASFNTLEAMQGIPVIFSTLSQDIPILQEKIREQILDLVKQRWKLVQELKLYSKIG